MSFEKFLDRAIWTIMVGVAAYGATQLQSNTVAVGQLNEKLAVVISQMGMQTKSIEDHEARLRVLELRNNGR